MYCMNCNVMRINGILCHETGCIDSTLDLTLGMYVHECFECGFSVFSTDRNHFKCNCNEENTYDTYE